MFKGFTLIFMYLYVVNGLIHTIFTCDSLIIKDGSISNFTISYDYDEKLYMKTYHSPVFMNEYYDYYNHYKYRMNSSICNIEVHKDNIPILYRLQTDTLIKEINDISFYKRENDDIKEYTIKNNEYINSITYKDGTIHSFYNCVDDLTYPIPDFSICNYDDIICTETADNIFVIDESENVIEEDFNYTKMFLKDILNNYDISQDTNNIGIVFFGEVSRIVSNLTFNKKELITKINNVGRYRGGRCLSCALNDAISLFETNNRENSNKNIIIITNGEPNKPIKNNNNKKHIDCYTYGNCKNHCVNSKVEKMDCNKFCNNNDKNYCYENSCYKYNETDKSWNYDNVNNKCLINNEIHYNDCCVNNADGCCCEIIKIPNGCDIGDYDNDALTASINNIVNSNINIITINIGNSGNQEIVSKSKYNYNVQSYKELQTLKVQLVNNECENDDTLICGKHCNGFCDFNKECICPECVDLDSYCDEYVCVNPIDGCKLKSVKCNDDNKCINVTRNPKNEQCCEYSNVNCNLNNIDTIEYCEPHIGCYSEPIRCEWKDPCYYSEIQSYNHRCYISYNNSICPNKFCYPMTNTQYICSSFCDYDTDCGEEDSCGSWRCERRSCKYTSKCEKPVNSCSYLDSCNSENGCIYKERKCDNPPSKCYDASTGRCNSIDEKNYECIYDKIVCEQPTNSCQISYCDPDKGCVIEDVKCDTSDPCKTFIGCTDHPEWNNYTCDYVSKCEKKECKNVFCSKEGDCIYEDIICESKNECYNSYCENDRCIQKPIDRELIDPCGKCIEEYHKKGIYLDINNSLCEGIIFNDNNVPFNNKSISQSSRLIVSFYLIMTSIIVIILI